jgi:hypothetical protein
MKHPNCPQNTVIIYDKDDHIKHTLENHAIIRAKQFLTSQIGNFTINTTSFDDIPKLGTYTDVVTWDKVAIWIKDGTINTTTDTPIFKGRVTSTTGTFGDGGAITISGLDQGEVLLRRIKTHKLWTATDAHDIVDAICADLGLGTAHVEANANHVTLPIDIQTYWDVLKKVSDYWVDAGNQIKNDFYVNSDLELVWAARPLRTAAVETLTFGEDFAQYTLTTDGSEIKNHLAIYGKKTPFNAKDPNSIGRKYPVNGDSWTYDANWVATEGTISSANASPAPKVGATWLKCLSDAAARTHFHHHVEGLTFWVEGVEGYGILEFWACRHGAPAVGSFKCRIYCPDVGNSYETILADPGVDDTWAHYYMALGTSNTYNATTNPDGIWTVTAGSPSWDTMKGIEFESLHLTGETDFIGLDGLSFSYGRWRSLVENAASQTAYGIRDTAIVDDDLATDAECEIRGQSLLWQMKDPVQRLDITVPGSNNLLLGDRLPITLLVENLTAANFDVISVEHVLTCGTGWICNLSLQGSVNHRVLSANKPSEIIVRELRRQSDVARGVTIVGR